MKKIYRASFALGSESSKPSIEQVVEEVRGWVSQRFKGDMADFEKGMKSSAGADTLTTINTSDESRKYFAARFEHNDTDNDILRWDTDVVVSADGRKSMQAVVELANGTINSPAIPHIIKLTRPKIVPLLVDRFSAHEKYSLSSKPTAFDKNNVHDLVNMIMDSGRQLPIVCISSFNKTDKPVVPADFISSQLAGIAHVSALMGRWASFKMGELMDPALCCYDGAVRLYWPMREWEKNKIFHPVWTRDKIFERADFHRQLLAKISASALARDTKINFEIIRNIEAEQAIRTLHKDGNQLIDIYSQQISELKKANLEYEQREILHQQETALLKDRLANYEEALRNVGRQDVIEDEGVVIPEFQTVREAVGFFKGRFDDGRVRIVKKAEKGAEESIYERPNQIYNALQWLATGYIRIRLTGGNLEESCRIETGMEYRAHQSELTLSEYSDDYHAVVDGKKVVLEEHLAKGNSKDPKSTIRIGFAFDDHQVIVGYIGPHQRNRMTN